MWPDPEYYLMNDPESPILETDQNDEWENFEDEDNTGD